MSSRENPQGAGPPKLTPYEHFLQDAEAERTRLAEVKTSPEYELACHAALKENKLEYELHEAQYYTEYVTGLEQMFLASDVLSKLT